MNFLIILKLILIFDFSVGTADENVLPLLMPNISSDIIREDTYLCTAYETNPEYVTEFKPNAPSSHSLHHMLIIGCETIDIAVNSERGHFWECKYNPMMLCGPGRSTMIYAWSRNAPTFALPEGSGFKVGGDSKINYLVLHVHYFDIDQTKIPQNPGFFLKTIDQSLDVIQKNAGIFFLRSGVQDNRQAFIPSNDSLRVENVCPLNLSKEVHPFAIRSNTNGRGRVVSVWHISGSGVWNLLGRYSPNPFQEFYPIRDKNTTIEPNDWLAMRCTYFNDLDHDVYFGRDDSTETCNSYIMYYADGDDPFGNSVCSALNSWANEPNLPGGYVPDWVERESSRLDFDN